MNESNNDDDEFISRGSSFSSTEPIDTEHLFSLCYPSICKIMLDEVQSEYLLYIQYLLKIEPFTLVSA
jgi:hypothetical protein